MILDSPGADPAPSTSGSDPAAARLETRRPWLTYAACAVCLLVFVGITLQGSARNWDDISRWGAQPSDKIWEGRYWALVSSCFVHVEVWHVAFNVYWLWILGGTLERLLGPARWLAFFVASAITSSGMQLGSSGGTGIGMSGVVYAIFGFLWVATRRKPELRGLLSRGTVQLFFFWLVGCIAADAAGVWEVGNVAHVSGILFGALLGLAYASDFPKRRWAAAGATVLLASSIVPLFWCPWSFHWTARKGYLAHGRGDYAEAIRYYERSLDMAVDPVWSLQNLAWAYYESGARERFTATMAHLRRLDRKAAEILEGEIQAMPRR